MSVTLLTKDELLSALNGEQIGHADCIFNDVQTDSRNVSSEKKCMFVPLVGEFQNGHKFIPDVLVKKASVIILNKSEYKKDKDVYEKMAGENPDVCFICVENTLTALQNAAEAYVNKVAKSMIRVSITGSSGKTTTKEMMVAVCKAYFGDENVAYTKGNFNSETGLPLSVFKIRGDEKIGIFEMGMNRVNEIGEISKVWKSQYGIITNIGTAHIGILGSRENIAKEKRKSLDYIPSNGAAFVCSSDSYGDFCCENVKGKKIKYGPDVDEKISGVKFLEDKGLFGCCFSIDGLKVQLSLSGLYNYTNALAVIACAKELGIPTEAIKKGLENVTAVSGRMETKQVLLKNNKKAVLIKDCYNANLDSMLKVIEFCNSLKEIGKKIFVLADMKELGSESEKSHQIVGQEVNKVNPDYVFMIGQEMKACFDVLQNKDKAFWYEEKGKDTFSKIAEKINCLADENDVILLKGSNSMELENLIPLLVNEE